jgi:hypothetical protein
MSMQAEMGTKVSIALSESLIAKLEEYEPTVMSLGDAVRAALEEFFRIREQAQGVVE